MMSACWKAGFKRIFWCSRTDTYVMADSASACCPRTAPPNTSSARPLKKAERDAAQPRRGDRPVQDGEHQERGAYRGKPQGQGQHGEDQRHHHRQRHAPEGVAGTVDH